MHLKIRKACTRNFSLRQTTSSFLRTDATKPTLHRSNSYRLWESTSSGMSLKWTLSSLTSSIWSLVCQTLSIQRETQSTKPLLITSMSCLIASRWRSCSYAFKLVSMSLVLRESQSRSNERRSWSKLEVASQVSMSSSRFTLHLSSRNSRRETHFFLSPRGP